MSFPDWLHGVGHEHDGSGSEVSIVGVVAWIAAMVVAANLLFVAQRFLG